MCVNNDQSYEFLSKYEAIQRLLAEMVHRYCSGQRRAARAAGGPRFLPSSCQDPKMPLVPWQSWQASSTSQYGQISVPYQGPPHIYMRSKCLIGNGRASLPTAALSWTYVNYLLASSRSFQCVLGHRRTSNNGARLLSCMANVAGSHPHARWRGMVSALKSIFTGLLQS